MANVEIIEFHPDGHPVGHPGMSAGLRGFAERANRQAFAPLATRRPGQNTQPDSRIGGLLVFPDAVTADEGNTLASLARNQQPDATVLSGHFFSGRFAWAEGKALSATWSANAVCLDVTGIDQKELFALGERLVTELDRRVLLVRSDTNRAIHIITADAWRFF